MQDAASASARVHFAVAVVHAFRDGDDAAAQELLLALPLDARLQMATLSKRWRALVYAPALYDTISFAGVALHRRIRDTAPMAEQMQRFMSGGAPGGGQKADGGELGALCARGGGAAVRVLDVSHPVVCAQLTAGGVLAAARRAGGGLRELRTLTVKLHGVVENGFQLQAWQFRAAQAAELARACPALRAGCIGLHGEGEHALEALAALPGVQRCAYLTGITPERTRALCAVLQALAAQPPAGAAAGGDAAARACANAGALTCLNLERNAEAPLRDAGVIALATALEHHPALTALELGWSGIRDDGAAAIAQLCARNPRLLRLDLGNDDDGAGARNAIGDAGAHAIAAALQAPGAALTHLGLAGNGLGDEAAVALADALRSNGTLRVLQLQRNRIGMRGIAALADAVTAHPTLADVTVWYNEARAAGAYAMHVALRRSEPGATCGDADVAACFTLRGMARRLAAAAADEEGRLQQLQALADVTRSMPNAFGSGVMGTFARGMMRLMGHGGMMSHHEAQLAPARDAARAARVAADALAVVWAWAKKRAAPRLESKEARARWEAEHALFPYRPFAGGHEPRPPIVLR
jgi:hypothetical protein